MIDLHLHLDGSLTPDQVIALAKLQGVPLPTEDRTQLEALLSVPTDCQSLNDYLRCFDLPVSVLQSGEGISLAVEGLVCRLREQGLLYGEIRFAPQLHCTRGLTQHQVVEAALSGLRRGMKKASGISCQLILCCMRGGEEAANEETVNTAAYFLGNGVCALDLAGAEALYPVELYRSLFSRAVSLQMPFTIHAGEAAGPESVWNALEMGASRIGHGVRSREEEDLLVKLAETKIPLELCPTSNVQTKAVSGFPDFPLRDYMRRGLVVTLNTDNMTVSSTTLQEEYRRLSITKEESRVLLRNSVEAAFLSRKGKEELLRKVEEQEGA